MGSQCMTSSTMRLVILSLCLSLAWSVPSEPRKSQKWHPAGPRDLSKYKLKTPSRSFAKTTETTKNEKKTPFEFKKGTKSFEDICGLENPGKERIVGGHEAAENEWPWQVALFIDDAWFCGGSIISDEYVMTAAHCADGASYFDIMAGAHNVRASSEPHRVEITSYNGWTHPQWNTADLSNDLALIELPSPIDFNDYIKPSCIPSKGDTADVSELVTCTGWGKPSDSAGGISPVLRMVEDRPIISNAECNGVYGIVGSGVVCIDTTGGKGTCNGDSGGPLNMKAEVTKAGQQWKQVGVVSFGASAGCEVGYPAGFTRVEYYLEWIMSETGMQL